MDSKYSQTIIIKVYQYTVINLVKLLLSINNYFTKIAYQKLINSLKVKQLIYNL